MANKIYDIIKNPFLLFLTFGHREWFNWMSDELYLKIAYWVRIHKQLNLLEPKTFNEKLQWIKLYDRNPLYTKLVDKYEVKSIVENKIGRNFIIPTLGVWEKFDDIDFEKLPNKFVLKCTHDSGGIIICKEKSLLNIDNARNKINKCLAHSFYWGMREWPYKNVLPRIIAEQYIEDNNSKGLRDYKIHNFNGEPKFILVCGNRYSKNGLTEDFYDVEWNHMNIRRPDHPNSNELIPKPEELEEMLELSRQLSKGIPFVRTDFYIVDHKVLFGEITFFPASGLTSFVPSDWDKIFGEWIKLKN